MPASDPCRHLKPYEHTALVIVVVTLAGLLILLGAARARRNACLALVLLVWAALVALFGTLALAYLSRIVVVSVAIVISLRHTSSLY